MSQLMDKAKAFEEKGKWKNAADNYLLIAKELLEVGDTDSAKAPLLKALETAEKGNIESLIIDIVFVFENISTGDERKTIFSKAIKPLDHLIEVASSKKQYQNLIEIIDKKIMVTKILEQCVENALLEKGNYLFTYAFSLITNKKAESRKLGEEYLAQASDLFIEINRFEELVERNIEAFTSLLEAGFVNEGLEVFDNVIDFCKKNDLIHEASIATKKIFLYSHEILSGKGNKKLIKALKETLSETDPGGELIEHGITKAKEMQIPELMVEAASILSDYAELMYEKKKYSSSKIYYDKSLQLAISIESKDTAKTLAEKIIEKAYALVKINDKFEIGLEFFSVVHQIEKVDLDFVGDFYKEKAEYLYSINKTKLALEDYKSSSKAYLFGKLNEKFTEITNIMFKRTLKLVSSAEQEVSLLFIESVLEILEGVQAYEQIGTNLTNITIEFMKVNQIKEVETYSIKAVENLLKAGSVLGAANSHKAFGESLIGLEHFDGASFHLVEAAKLYKNVQKEDEIISTITPLIIAAKNKLGDKNIELAKQLLSDAILCAQQKDSLTEVNIIHDFVDYAVYINQKELALEYLVYATKTLGRSYPEETKRIANKLSSIGKMLVISDHNFSLGRDYLEQGVLALTNISENVEASQILIDNSQLLFDNNQNDLAKELLMQITKILTGDTSPDIFAEKLSLASKILISYNFIEEGIDLLRKAVGAYFSLGMTDPIIELAYYCSENAKTAIRNEEVIFGKHLYIAAMEFSSPVNLEIQDLIISEASNMFLDIGDLYSVKEFHDYAKNNLEGEKDYLAKLGRLIIVQGGSLRDSKEMFDEASEFIRSGIKILNQVGNLDEAGEAALAQGYLFLDKANFIYGEELIETAAQIFLQINDIERSGDAFQALAEVNIRREHWQDAYRQIELANKSYAESKNLEKLAVSSLKTAEIGSQALTHNPEEYRKFALSCFDAAIDLAKHSNLTEIVVDIFMKEARTFATTKDYQTAYNVFLQAVNELEQQDKKTKSPNVADELSNHAIVFIQESEIELGLHLIDLATGIHLRLGKPISASEIYMKSCNALLKLNRVVKGIKLVLLASDTLMVANEFEAAVKILVEIADLLYEMKDYQNASIVTGQIVTVHQKTGNIEEQKKAIHVLVVKAQEVINNGKIMEGEQLWEQVANYSISTSIEFAIEINNLRIANLMNAGMYNSTNNAFKQILPLLESDPEILLEQGDRIASIANELFEKNEFELTKNFIFTAIEYYKKSANQEKAKNLCLNLSESFIQNGDETNGIELIDQAANIANEMQGAHEAAKIYLYSGFILAETGYLNSGKLAIDKAIDIEMQTKNISGCIELGEITIQKAQELAQSDLEKSNEIYTLAIKIFECAESYTKAGKTCSVISANHLNVGKADEAIIFAIKAVDYYLKDKNIDLAVTITKQTIDSARRFMEENELTKAVHILEKARLLVEKISRFDLLSLIINIYLSAASQNLPNRKSAIGIFFLNRSFELAKSSPDPEEIKQIIDLVLKLALDIIRKKNSIAGAKVLEIVTNQEISKQALLPLVSETLIEALKITLDVEWNMIGKISRDALRFYKATNQDENISQMILVLTRRANADIMLNKPQLGFFFLDYAIRLAKEAENIDLLTLIGKETFEQLQILDLEADLEINYRLLGYCYQMFQEIQNMDYIEKIGKEFIKLGSKDLVNNMQSLRGYEALLTARDIAIQTQSDNLISTVVLAMLDFAKQSSINNARTTISTLDDITSGLEAYEVPNSNRATIEYELIKDYIKALTAFGEKVSKSDQNYSLGQKIVEACMRILALSKNQVEIEKDITEAQKNLQKLIKRGNRESAFRLRHTATLMIDLRNSNIANEIAESSFHTAQELLEKKKYNDSISFLDTSLKLNTKLSMQTELKNIGLFALSAGDRLVNEGKILESMIFYDIAVEAFDLANDDESSNRLVNRIFQTREWDADVTIAYQCYKIASDSAIRIKNYQKANEIARKCFNRGIAFIDQPRIPINLTNKFITLAGKILEDIGTTKDAANAYDNAILKYIRIMKTRKNIESVIIELLTKAAVNRMASCDMDSLETIYLRVMELAEMKKSKPTKTFARVLKLINSTKVGAAWDVLASLPYISHGRIRKIIEHTKYRIVYELTNKGTFDRTIFSTTDRSLPLSDFLLESLQIARRIEGQPINKDVFISLHKIQAIRSYLYSEYDLWGRIELETVANEFGIQHNDTVSIVRREFLSVLYMAILDNEQKIFYSFDRLKAEISLILNRERKKASIFDPMQVANEMRIPPDIIKEVLREISCEEVVENAVTL